MVPAGGNGAEREGQGRRLLRRALAMGVHALIDAGANRSACCFLLACDGVSGVAHFHARQKF